MPNATSSPSKSKLEFQEKLKVYAELLVRHGVNIQPGQDLFISTEAIHRDFAVLVAETAYKVGARLVQIDFTDPRLARARILQSQKEEYLTYVPPFIPVRFDSMIPAQAANLKIIGSEDPDSLADLDPKKIQTLQLNLQKSLKTFYEVGIGHSKVQWTVAAAATPKWGRKVFPHLSEEEACDALWDAIFHVCRADRPDCLSLWKEHNTVLQTRAQKLTDLKIETLHFTGPGTDLKVTLSPYAKWKGGGDLGPRGAEFEPNIPTEECFTTPNAHLTEGIATTTRPFLINGKQIRSLKLEFKQGKIIHFSADEGEETFAEYIKSDTGACKLGEVALVGIDSPIYETKHVFEEILFDENAACHIAIGLAYRFCIQGAEKMSPEELEKIGCNTSVIHTDMMISDDQVNVVAEWKNGKKIELIQKGRWVDFT